MTELLLRLMGLMLKMRGFIVQCSAKTRVMNPQYSIVSPTIGLKRAQNSEKQYKKWSIKAVFALTWEETNA